MVYRERNIERDKQRPIEVHSMAVLIQRATACDDDEALDAAWDVWDFVQPFWKTKG